MIYQFTTAQLTYSESPEKKHGLKETRVFKQEKAYIGMRNIEETNCFFHNGYMAFLLWEELDMALRNSIYEKKKLN